MSNHRQTCVISLGLTIMDRCPECDKIDNAAHEEERIVRNREFAAKWSSRDEVDCERASEPARRTEPARSSCGCVEVHPDGTSFFVSCIEDSGQRRKVFLLGPYDTHEEALANVERGRKLAEDNDSKAHWYSFGTCSISEPTERKGVFGK